MMRELYSNSYLFSGNAPYVEEMYEAYLDDPGSVSEHWRDYFDALQHLPAIDGSSAQDVAHAPVIESFAQRARHGSFSTKASDTALITARKQVHVQSLISAYRTLGARWANLDPLKRQGRPHIPELDPMFYDLSEADMDTVFSAEDTFFSEADHMTLREIVQALRQTYCGSIGAEYMHISEPVEKRWWKNRLEEIRSTPEVDADGKKRILERLTAAEGLERYLHVKYVGQKRYSLEGSESFVVAMDELVQRAGVKGVREIVIAMAHRGRLNVLVNILGKATKDLFAEFDHTAPEDLPSGDVKYHMGFSSDISTAGGPVHLSLAFNPSHLEIVGPVAEGSAKARLDRRGDKEGRSVLPVLVHGDAAFAGQGVVMETMALAQTRGYYTGGTVHVVINNQIGFTTSDPRDSRSTLYCTDVAKMIEAPVLHVNGDDPEAVVLCTQLALDYRQAFNKDVVVDIVCYRMRGHNEQDTPELTQPLMYRKVATHPGTRKLYGEKLVAQRLLEAGAPDELVRLTRAALDSGSNTSDPVLTDYKRQFAVNWAPFLQKKWTDAADTALPLAEIKRLAERITTLPVDFQPHALVRKVIADRAAMGRGEIPVDWGMGEHLAFASLVASGFAVRLSGEDCGRGTFSHRHAVLHDQNREKWDAGTYTPLGHVAKGQASFAAIDSILSEEAVLGFEYGYASAEPNTLVVWESQFGDFANGAQVVIDQFIASGEVKWGRANGLTLMLPHGYEGQGPEHSSARIERFMQLAADNNIQVVQPSSASQIFHVLRRQMVRMFRKPLIIMTPKSLLRAKDASSPLAEFTDGEFKTVIGEQSADGRVEKIKRVIVCSGKVFYDLSKARAERKSDDVAVVRVEQLYPFPHKAFAAEVRKYPNLAEVVWCQDEPQNQGGWLFMQRYLYENMNEGQRLGYAGRPASASPAVGYIRLHQEQQRTLIDHAFGKLKGLVLTK